jgi:DeoR/GlpR family transcriptional regulator of sugar metabolism
MAQLADIRRQELKEYLRERGHGTIAELCARFGVSVATVHRDLNALLADGMVRKVHGGVEYTAPQVGGEESWNSGFTTRLQRNCEAKVAIAEKALALLEEDDVAFLDSSTTCLHLARAIRASSLHRLTLVTNSNAIANEFPSFPSSFTLISLGGSYNPQLNSFLGGMTRDAAQHLRLRKVFLSAVGVSVDGAFTFHENHAAFLRELVEQGGEGVLLADASKFGREALFRICGLERLHVVVSDPLLQAAPRAWLAAAGCAVH